MALVPLEDFDRQRTQRRQPTLVPLEQFDAARAAPVSLADKFMSVGREAVGNLKDAIVPPAEAATSLASGFASFFPALAGGAAELLPLEGFDPYAGQRDETPAPAPAVTYPERAEQAGKTMASIADTLTYQPRTAGGKALIKPVNEAMEAGAEIAHIAGEQMADRTDSPLAAAITEQALNLAPWIIGGKALGGVRPMAEAVGAMADRAPMRVELPELGDKPAAAPASVAQALEALPPPEVAAPPEPAPELAAPAPPPAAAPQQPAPVQASGLQDLYARLKAERTARPVEPEPAPEPAQPEPAPRQQSSAAFAAEALRDLRSRIIKMGGIAKAEMPDITGEGRADAAGRVHTGAGGLTRRLFTDDGVGIDTLAESMPEHFPSGEGGTLDPQRVRDVVRAIVNGDHERALSPEQQSRYAELRMAEDAADQQAAHEAAQQAKLAPPEPRHVVLEREAQALLSDDEREGIATQHESDDQAYYQALEDAINGKRLQEDGEGSGQAQPAVAGPEARAGEGAAQEVREPADAGALPGAVEATAGLQSRSAARSGSTPEAHRVALGKQLGRGLVKRMEDEGVLQFVSGDTLPHPLDQASWDGRTARIAYDRVSPERAVGVLLHEVGEHAGMEKMLGPDKYADIQRRFEALLESGDKAAERASAAVPKDTRPEHVQKERLAYLIEHVVNARDRSTFSKGVRDLVQEVVARIRAWAFKTMPRRFVKGMELKPADIAALARQAVDFVVERAEKSRAEAERPLTEEDLIRGAEFSKKPPPLKLEQYTEDDLRAKAEREKAAEKEAVARPEDFKLEQPASAPDAGQEPLFSREPEPSQSELIPRTAPERRMAGATSIKNEETASQRAERGMEPAEQAAKRDFGEVWEDARPKDEADWQALSDLVAELKDNPRPVTDTEDAQLLYRQIQLQKQHDTLLDRLADAEHLDPVDLAAARATEARVGAELETLYDVTKAVGTATARGLNARRIMARHDFTLAAMQARLKAAKGGEALTPQESEKVKALSKRLRELEDQLDEREADKHSKRAHAERVVEADRKPADRKTAEQKVRGRITQLEKIVEEAGEIPRSLIQALAREAVQMGERDRAGLVDTVHGILTDLGAKLTKREVMDAISGYGDFRALSKGEVDVELRRMKGELQQLGKLEDMERGLPPLKSGVERRVPGDAERALIRQVNDMKKRLGLRTTDPETQLKSTLDSIKTRLRNQIHDLQQRMDEGNFAPRVRNEVKYDQEALKLRFDAEVVKRQYNEMLFKHKLAQRGMVEKVFDTGVEIMNTARALVTSFDLSAVLRQGGFIALGHPLRALKIFPDMFRALASEKGQFRVNEEIQKRPNAPLYKSARLYLSDQDNANLSKLEEAYMSRWANKLPGVGASQRAYVTFLNRLRADSFDALARSLTLDGKPTLEESKAIANFVNKATGRGSFGGTDQANVVLNTVFFSPRYLASRFQLLTGQPLWKGTAGTRKLIAREYARFMLGVGTIYGLGALAGAEVENDPRSSDFGKVHFGNTRIDPLTGLQQITVLGSRLTSGQTKDLEGEVNDLRGEDREYGQPDATDVVKRFLRSKLSPAAGLAMNLAAGSDFMGRPVTPLSVAQSVAVPISGQDIYTVLTQDENVPRASALALLAILGMGVQIHQETEQ